MARKNHHSSYLLILGTLGLFIGGVLILWISSLRIPDLGDISERKIDQSTKLYDRTGEILLYDLSQDVRRIRVSITDISPYVLAATIAIEDKNFYSHNGFQWTSFLRAVLVNLSTLSFNQGGSTITQQVVKNSILTKDKTPTRKLKELILAIKLEKVLTKDEILSLYLNEIPYGGTIYGIAEAAQSFFNKKASELTLAESAYLASLPKAPTFYSPFGPNRPELELRKNLILHEMLTGGVVSKEEYQNALTEKVEFKPKRNTGGIKAPHFVFFVLDFLAKKYGDEAIQNGNYKIITTLDYELQEKAEILSKKYGIINKEKFNGENNGLVGIDPKNGDILMMVGSRDYFDKEIDGNFNVTTGLRQPGSTFKPFMYATMFKKGYTDRTILYDARIQFAANCEPSDFTTNEMCYAPVNYDDHFRGPMTIRNALAQSINIPAVQGIYLAGVSDSIITAKSMGISSLNDHGRYGLSLVLGGGEVSLLDITSAYSVFANNGVRNAYNPILLVEDAEGKVVDKRSPSPNRVLSEQVSRLINDILSDNIARTPGFGVNSALYIPSRPVAVKTGTSNDYRDAWIIGYTPNLTVGAWVGNNDSRPMERKVSGLVVAPLWHEYMESILSKFPIETFNPPEPEDLSNLKPILRGDWSTGGTHSILYWIDKDNPRGPTPINPSNDPQFLNWEYGIQLWSILNNLSTTTQATTTPN